MSKGDTQRPDLATRLRETAERVPDRVALRWQGRATTYRELDERVGRAAAALQRLGIHHGDRVALMVGNTPVFAEAFLGALRAGAAVVPLNPGYTSEEVAHCVADSGAQVLVASEPAHRRLGNAVDRLAVDHVVVAGPQAGGWRQLLADAGAPRPVRRGPDDVAAIVYTSGTTGRPKGAVLTRRNLAANQDQVLASPLAVREDDVVLAVLPLFHIYAMNIGLGCAVRVGATLVLAERFDPLATLDVIAQEQVTVVLGAPAMYAAWLQTPGVDPERWGGVRVAVSGAAPLSPDVLKLFRDEHGLDIWEGYGLTEAAPAVTSNAVAGAPRPGAVGMPLPGVEIRLVDETGRDVDRGDPGEVWVRGDNVFRGYWQDEEATREVLTADGWLKTGDVGILDEDGYLHLVDRARDLIIVSGFNVYPREVEQVLHRHPGVAAAAVVGVAHPYTGEAVKAYVVPAPETELSEDEVIDFCRQHLARFKCPDSVSFVPELPTTATGKVRRGRLREATA